MLIPTDRWLVGSRFAKSRNTRPISCRTILAVLAVVFLSSCSSASNNSDQSRQARRRGCILASAAAGALTFGAGAAGAVYATDCAPKCVEQAIRAGVPQNQAINQHINNVESTMIYAGIPAAVLGGISGGLLGSYACENQRINDYARSLNEGRKNGAVATASEHDAPGPISPPENGGSQAQSSANSKSGHDATIAMDATASNPATDTSAQESAPADANNGAAR